jgi:hypothetical protein
VEVTDELTALAAVVERSAVLDESAAVVPLVVSAVVGSAAEVPGDPPELDDEEPVAVIVA